MRKLIIFLILLLILPTTIFASAVSNVDYDIEAVYIRSDIDSVGNLHVKEAIIVNGSLNGFERVINYKNDFLNSWTEGEQIDFSNSAIYNGKGMSIEKVSSFKINKEEIGYDVLSHEMEDYTNSLNPNKGDSGVYLLTKNNNGLGIRVFNPNSYGYVVYYFQYYIDQAVVLHNDIAEIYWQFIPTDFDYINNAHIQLTIPGSCTDKTFRMWAHGPITGEISGISEKTDDEGNKLYNGVSANVVGVTPGEGVDIRVTFDKSLVSLGSSMLNKSGVDALDKIIEVEEVKAEEANEIRETIRSRNRVLGYLSILYVVVLVIIWILIYRKYDKEYKVLFDAKYYREFTGDYDVEVVDYLMNKNVSTNAMSASIMNLIYKKNIEIIENPEDKKNPTLKLISKESTSASENILIELLFNQVGKNGTLAMKTLEKYSKKYSTAEKFMHTYDNWKDSVERAANKEEFFEDHTSKKIAAASYVLVGVIIFFITIDSMPLFMPLIMVLSSFAFLIYIFSFKKWTVKGREHYLKWNAFKNF